RRNVGCAGMVGRLPSMWQGSRAETARTLARNAATMASAPDHRSFHRRARRRAGWSSLITTDFVSLPAERQIDENSNGRTVHAQPACLVGGFYRADTSRCRVVCRSGTDVAALDADWLSWPG